MVEKVLKVLPKMLLSIWKIVLSSEGWMWQMKADEDWGIKYIEALPSWGIVPDRRTNYGKLCGQNTSVFEVGLIKFPCRRPTMVDTVFIAVASEGSIKYQLNRLYAGLLKWMKNSLLNKLLVWFNVAKHMYVYISWVGMSSFITIVNKLMLCACSFIYFINWSHCFFFQRVNHG